MTRPAKQSQSNNLQELILGNCLKKIKPKDQIIQRSRSAKVGDNDSVKEELLSAQWGFGKGGEEADGDGSFLKIWLQQSSVMCPISKWVHT